MDIIVVSHKRGRTWRFPLDLRHALGWLPLVGLVIVVVSTAFAAGFFARGAARVQAGTPSDLLATWSEEVRLQREEPGGEGGGNHDDDEAYQRQPA
jgi:hypothetical protein